MIAKDAVIRSIQQFGSFSDEETALLFDCLEHQKVEREDHLLMEGEVCKELAFVIKGSFREFFLNENHDEVVVDLFISNEWVFDLASFTSQKPSEYRIEAFEDSEVLSISVHKLHKLIEAYPSFFALGKILTPRNAFLGSKIKPEDKYRTLLDSSPEIVKTFPLKYIASYLGMTPETLSRVRNRIR